MIAILLKYAIIKAEKKQAKRFGRCEGVIPVKKKNIILLCCAALVLVVLVVAAVVVLKKLPMPLNYPIDEIESAHSEGQTVSVIEDGPDSVTLQKTVPGAFKVLMFTDMHLDGKNKTSYTTVDRMVKSIQKEKPDLVLLGGDNVTSGKNEKRSHQLAQIFENLDVYWGGVLGNHEGDNKFSVTRSEMVDIFSSYDHCVMRPGPADVDGDCNYAIHLLDSDGTHIQTVFCLDTFDEISEERQAELTLFDKRTAYDGAHENQVEWYRAKAEALKETWGEDSKSVLLVHIPLHEYDVAIESETPLYGEKREDICSTAYDNGLFKAIKDEGVTQAVFCGHDHLNNFGVLHDSVILSYIEPSGYGAYGMGKRGAPESEWLQGYTELQILPDGTFSHGQVRYAEVFEVDA